VSWNVYDQYLKANRVESGVRSYSQVVTLILRTRFEAAGCRNDSTGCRPAKAIADREPRPDDRAGSRARGFTSAPAASSSRSAAYSRAATSERSPALPTNSTRTPGRSPSSVRFLLGRQHAHGAAGREVCAGVCRQLA
jgi:hypothetical protein